MNVSYFGTLATKPVDHSAKPELDSQKIANRKKLKLIVIYTKLIVIFTWIGSDTICLIKKVLWN